MKTAFACAPSTSRRGFPACKQGTPASGQSGVQEILFLPARGATPGGCGEQGIPRLRRATGCGGGEKWEQGWPERPPLSDRTPG